MSLNPFSNDIGEQVLVAFRGDDADWRTLGGIVRESGLDSHDVTKFLEENKECFIESTVRPGGNVLYRIRHDLRRQALAAARAQRLNHASG